METLIRFLKRPIIRRLIIFALLGLMLFLLRDLTTLFLLTFVFIYLFNSAQRLLLRLIRKKFQIKSGFVTAFLYLLFVGLLTVFISIYVPVIARQVTEIVGKITRYLTSVKNGGEPKNLYTQIVLYLSDSVNIEKYISGSGNAVLRILSGVGTAGLYCFLSLILSLFYLVDKKGIHRFIARFQLSRLSWMYDDFRSIFIKFTNSFGKVIQAQIIISGINALLSIILLAIMGFPSVVALGFMILILGLVPVAGVFISLVPLSLIAYSIGGLQKVVYVLIMIAVLHALESYVLNPKLMSSNTHIPVFFTFLVLMISEHIFGIWGLIVGIPITVFLLDLLDVIPDPTS